MSHRAASWRCRSGFDPILGAEAATLDGHGLGGMQRAVQRCGGHPTSTVRRRPCEIDLHPFESERHRGTCYKATNWVHVGETAGRGKMSTVHQHIIPIKDIWLYPLRKNFAVAWELCAGLIVVVTGGLARMQWAFYKKHL
jgi:hypothetical protein